MTSIRVEGSFEAAHRLPEHLGDCKNLHGHSYRVVLTIHGTVKSIDGMIIDFGTVKQLLKQVLGQLDHRVILRVDDPLCEVLRVFPANIGLVLLNNTPTAENIAAYIFSQLYADLEDRLDSFRCVVEVFETATNSAIVEG